MILKIKSTTIIIINDKDIIMDDNDENIILDILVYKINWKVLLIKGIVIEK